MFLESLRSKLPQPERMTVGLILRPRSDNCSAVLARQAMHKPARREYFDFDGVQTRYGAADEDIAQVIGFADRHELDIVEINRDSRLILLAGPTPKIILAFHVSLVFDRIGEQVVHFLEGDGLDVLTDGELSGVIEGMFGLDSRPHFGFFHFSLRSLEPPWLRADSDSDDSYGGDQDSTAPDTTTPDTTTPGSTAGTTTKTSDRVWTDPADCIRRYRFPQATGRGQTIGILTLGGGFHAEDMKAYFGDAVPEIEVVTIGEAKNDPAAAEDVRQYLAALRSGKMPEMSEDIASQVAWTLETTQDLQLAGSFAPGAKLVLYIGSNTELGEVHSLLAALNDRNRDIDVLSCSWGTGEHSVSPNLAKVINETLQHAALRGVTVCCASGDKGADLENGEPNAHFPSSCPMALSCGGTTPHDEEVTPEVVWNESRGPHTAASGGGFSRFFEQPTWQQGTGGKDRPQGRGVPDVAAKADLTQGYRMIVAGQEFSGGGTSASTPLWAALIARCNEVAGRRAGWLNPLLYRDHMSQALRRVPIGNNGYYHANDHWDPCTGWGTPDGEELVKLLLEE